MFGCSGWAASAPQADEFLPSCSSVCSPHDDDVQLLPRSEYEHSDAVRTQARRRFSSIRLRRLGDRDLAAGLDVGQELLVGGGGRTESALW